MDARPRRTTSWPRMHSYAAVTSSAGNRALLLLIVLAIVCHTFGYGAAEDGAYHAGETSLREKFESVQARMKAMLKTKARLLSHPVRTLASELTRLETRDSSDDGSNADDGMSVESLDSDGQTGLDWDRTAGPNIPVATKPPGGDTTPGTCIVCENVLLISQDALAEFIRLFETFESDSMQQISVVTTDLNAQRGLRCGRIRRTDGNTALIQFEQSAINITVNDTFAPLGVLRSFHDSAFVEGVGALRTILNVVTGETSRQVQRTRSGPFVDFPPTVEMCKNVMNCDPYATKAPSATPVPMTTKDPSSMIWPDPTEMQFLLSRNITFCESLQCSPTIPVPPLPQFCLDLFSMLPLPP